MKKSEEHARKNNEVNTEFKAIIKPGVGLGDIVFGTDAKRVIKWLGAPSESYLDDDGDRLVAFPQFGVSFFMFDCEENFRLTSYEVNKDSDVELWASQIFNLSLSHMTTLARSMGVSLEKADRPFPDSLKDGETLYQIRSHSLDFYYRKQQLVAVAGGVLSNSRGEINWPQPEAERPKGVRKTNKGTHFTGGQ